MLFRTAALFIAIAISSAVPAFAGGDDFEGVDDTEGAGPVYYGFVRDTRGLGVPDAEVVLTPKQGTPVILTSNRLGLYRSHVSNDVQPTDVEVICSKPGYKQTSVTRRQGGGRAIETDCTLQRL